MSCQFSIASRISSGAGGLIWEKITFAEDLKICRSVECAINHEGYVVVCREGVKSLLTNVKCQMHLESDHEG